MLKNKTELKETATLIRDYLMLQKRVAQIESWLEAVKDDGRVHGKVITNGAVTGRMTHSSPCWLLSTPAQESKSEKS